MVLVIMVLAVTMLTKVHSTPVPGPHGGEHTSSTQGRAVRSDFKATWRLSGYRRVLVGPASPLPVTVSSV